MIYHLGNANGPMIFGSATNFISGTRAKGSCTDCSILRVESIFVSAFAFKKVTQMAGMIAMKRVSSTRYQIGRVKFKKPSITN